MLGDERSQSSRDVELRKPVANLQPTTDFTDPRILDLKVKAVKTFLRFLAVVVKARELRCLEGLGTGHCRKNGNTIR